MTAPSQPLSAGGHRFGQIYPWGWHHGDGLDQVRDEHGTRVRQLGRMSIARLSQLQASQLRAAGRQITLGGSGVMSKDELISEIARHEFPASDQPEGQPPPG